MIAPSCVILVARGALAHAGPSAGLSGSPIGPAGPRWMLGTSADPAPSCHSKDYTKPSCYVGRDCFRLSSCFPWSLWLNPFRCGSCRWMLLIPCVLCSPSRPSHSRWSGHPCHPNASAGKRSRSPARDKQTGCWSFWEKHCCGFPLHPYVLFIFLYECRKSLVFGNCHYS